MNDQAILEQLALHPRSRAVQLADRADMPLDDVQAALVALVAIGDVVVSNDIAPNDKPCNVYELSATFKESARGQAIVAKAAAMRFRREHPTLDDIELAVAFVHERGTATSAELHALLGLQPDQQASVFLGSAVQDQLLVKDGKNWTLGPRASLELRDDAKPTAAPASSAAPSPAPQPVPRFLDAPAAPPTSTAAQTGTKVERAIACLRQHGTVATGQLREAIGLRAGQHPSNFLTSALADGRIVRDGDYWSLGWKLKERVGQIAATADDVRDLPQQLVDQLSKPAQGLAEQVKLTAPTLPSTAVSGCRFAIWSHGVVEIKKPGLPELELTIDEVEELIAFLTKMGEA